MSSSKLLIIPGLISCLLFSTLFTPITPQTSALSGSQFRADRIIDDAKFYRAADMPADHIQTFLNAKVPDCDTNGDEIYSGSTTRRQYAASRGVSPPFTCLKDYRQNTPTRNDSLGLCGHLSARSNRSAAAIIYDVSRVCGISAKALLVLLQKEQSLVTDEWPWPVQYRSATGFGCPDTAPCDSQYYGFFNQVYSAARQFKRYKAFSEDYNYRAGFRSYVQWHPQASCGGSRITMQNHATAGLYNYTPYRPNSAALANLYGEGNGCSSYGNRNFWRMYHDWFGSTLGDNAPDKALAGDWDGDGWGEIGLQRFDEYLLNHGNDGAAEEAFIFGGSGDTSFGGDWNADGRDTVGLKRGNLYFLNNGGDPFPEAVFTFGKPGEQAIVGDWDRDNRDELGIKRGNLFYLNTENDGVAEIVFTFGKPTDQGISGDWNGDGRGDVGIKRGNVYFLNYNFDGRADAIFTFGRPTDQPLVADWNNDGRDEISLKRGNHYFLNFEHDGSANGVFSYGR